MLRHLRAEVRQVESEVKELEDEVAAVFNDEDDEGDGADVDGEKRALDEGANNLKRSISASTEHLHTKQRFIVDSVWFNLAITAVVFLNTMQMGVEADYPEFKGVWQVCENLFTAAFFIEMVLKIAVLKLAYFEDRANWLDAGLTLMGVLDCWILVWIPGDTVDLQSMSILRILRLARLGRVVKLARKVKQFVLVISGVYKALVTTCWVFLLLIFVMYVCAIFCTEYIGRGEVDLYPGYSLETAVIDEQEIIINFNPYLSFGSMWLSMLTLFNIAVGGEWAEVVRPMAVKQPYLVLVFATYSMLIAFGVMNVMIGIIVDSVITESKNIDKEMQETRKSEKRDLLKNIQQLIKTLDTNHDDVVDLQELRRSFTKMTELQDLLSQCDLPAGWNSNELLFMLDNSGDGVLQKAEFTTSFFRLMDSDDFQQICIMQASINQVKHLVRQAHDKLEVHMAEVRKSLTVIHNAVMPDDAPERVIAADTALDGESGDECENVHRTDKPEEIEKEEVAVEPAASVVEAAAPQTKGSFSTPPTETFHHQDAKQESSALLDHVVECVDMACMKSLSPEQPMSALPGPRPKDGQQERALQSFSKELESDIKSIPLKKITDLLDLAFLAMRDSLHRELASLSQGEEMRMIAETNQVFNTAPLSSAECSTSAEGNSSVNASPGQEPGASCGIFVEATASCCMPQSQKDRMDMVTSNESEGAAEDHHPSCIQALKDIGWQALDRQSKPTWTISRPPCYTHGDVGDATAEDYVSVASGSHTGDARHQEAVEAAAQPISCAENHGNGAHHSVEVVFHDEETLGFEIQWFRDPDNLPLVRMTSPGGASDLRGVRLGDQLVQCNGASIQGKGRDEVLRLLKQRPLVLRLLRECHNTHGDDENPHV